MPSHAQGTTEKHPATQGDTLDGPAGSDSARLAGAFSAGSDAGSVHKIPTPAEITALGTQLLQTDVVNDGGHTFGTFDLNWADAPKFDDVVVGGGAGQPAHARAPSIASPGPGSANPADLPAGPDPLVGAGGAFPRGDTSLSPDATSAETGNQTLGALIFGKSSPTSDVGT